jgi:hypothetical protein
LAGDIFPALAFSEKQENVSLAFGQPFDLVFQFVGAPEADEHDGHNAGHRLGSQAHVPLEGFAGQSELQASF